MDDAIQPISGAAMPAVQFRFAFKDGQTDCYEIQWGDDVLDSVYEYRDGYFWVGRLLFTELPERRFLYESEAQEYIICYLSELWASMHAPMSDEEPG